MKRALFAVTVAAFMSACGAPAPTATPASAKPAEKPAEKPAAAAPTATPIAVPTAVPTSTPLATPVEWKSKDGKVRCFYVTEGVACLAVD